MFYIFLDGLDVGVLVGMGEVVFSDVAGEEGGFGGEEEELLGDGGFFIREREGECGLVLVEVGKEFFEDGLLGFCVGVTGAEFFLVALDAFLDGGEVGEDEFGGDGFDVADGVDGAGDVVDVIIGEAADDVDDGIDFADVGEELVAEAFALACAADEAGDIDDLDDGGDDFWGSAEGGEGLEARVGDGDDAGVGFDGAEGVVSSLGFAGAGEGVEEGAFADVGETDDACA